MEDEGFMRSRSDLIMLPGFKLSPKLKLEDASVVVFVTRQRGFV